MNKKVKKEISPAEIQKRRKRIVLPLFFLVFAAVMWVIFAPPKEQKGTAGQNGLNVELPMPTDDGLPADKRTAYENEAQRQKEQDKMRSLQDISALFRVADEISEESAAREEQRIRMAPKPPEYYDDPERFEGGGSSSERVSNLKASAIANENINRQLGSWNEPSAQTQESSAVDERIAELEKRLAEAEARTAAEDEQTALLEKSYQMAAQYAKMADGAGDDLPANESAAPKAVQSGRAAIVRPVRQIRRNVVSLLAAPMGDAEFVDAFSQPRNLGFFTAAGNEGMTTKNTIRACVDRAITITDGRELPIRLLEPMMVGDIFVPAGTVISGMCKIDGERMSVVVSSVQSGGNIIPVELMVYDMDGQQGIAVPGSDEINAMKEVAATLAQTSGSSITISNDAKSQFAADMGKGLIQGAAQYVSKKMSTIRVRVKANHALLLLPKGN